MGRSTLRRPTFTDFGSETLETRFQPITEVQLNYGWLERTIPVPVPKAVIAQLVAIPSGVALALPICTWFFRKSPRKDDS